MGVYLRKIAIANEAKEDSLNDTDANDDLNTDTHPNKSAGIEAMKWFEKSVESAGDNSTGLAEMVGCFFSSSISN